MTWSSGDSLNSANLNRGGGTPTWVSAADFAITADGATDNTSVLTTMLNHSSVSSSYRGIIFIPPDVRYDRAAFYAALASSAPGARVLDASGLGWSETGSGYTYTTRFLAAGSSGSALDDHPGLALEGGHHPALHFINYGTATDGIGGAQTSSASAHKSSIQWNVGLENASNNTKLIPIFAIRAGHLQGITAQNWALGIFRESNLTTFKSDPNAVTQSEEAVWGIDEAGYCGLGEAFISNGVNWQVSESPVNLDTRTDINYLNLQNNSSILNKWQCKDSLGTQLTGYLAFVNNGAFRILDESGSTVLWSQDSRGRGRQRLGLYVGSTDVLPTEELHLSGKTMRIASNAGTIAGNASGNTGDIMWGTASDTSYLYVCTSTDSWMRAALSPF